MILLSLLLLIPTIFNLLKPGYFSMHDDVQIMRLFEMSKCLRDLQLPCRWVPDMGAQYGHPLFNFHPVLPYYLGIFFKVLGFSYIWSAKLLFLLSLLLGNISMYFLASSLFTPLAGLVAAALYTYAPYHAVDVYVRGALTEAWGLAFFPLIFFAFYRFVQKPTKVFFLLAVLSLVGLFLSHNIMALLFTPITLIWVIFWIKQTHRVGGQTRHQHLLRPLLFIFLLSLGLSSFFLLPAFFEKSLLNFVSATGYFRFQDHFVSLYQLLIRRHWGYGPSVDNFHDDFSFQAGMPHWFLAVIGFLLICFLRRQKLSHRPLNYLLLAGFFLTALMTLPVSLPLWRIFPIFVFIQFPWRFLGLNAFFSSLLVGTLLYLPGKYQKPALLLTLVFTVILNFSFFRPQIFRSEATEDTMLGGEHWYKQSFNPLLDYYPKTVKELPTDYAPQVPTTDHSDTKITNFQRTSNRWQFDADIQPPLSAQIEVPIFEFPIWKVTLDNQPIDHQVQDPRGTILVTVPPGQHHLEGKLTNTPIRNLSNVVSALSVLIFFGILLRPLKFRP